MTAEHPKIDIPDWRLHVSTTLAKEFSSPWTGKIHPVGSAVTLATYAKIAGHDLSFGLPSMTAVMISLSHRLWDDAEADISEKVLSSGMNHERPVIKDLSALFDVLEKRMAAIVFAYTALESFANESIPDDFIYEKVRADGRNTERYTKDQIERFLSLTVKLAEVIPPILNVKPPKGTAIWARFVALGDLRDRIIHLKTVDRQNAKVGADTIWGRIFDARHPNFAVESKNIIEYYLSTSKDKPRWLEQTPF